MTTAIQSNAIVFPQTENPSWVDRALYPFAPRRFQTPDGAISYLDEGSGAPIVFVHGTPSWSFEWREVIQAMRKDHRCIAPDHLGFGLSDKPEGGALSPEDHARRLQALIEALDLQDITLVVHDFGGPIGMAAAMNMRTRIRRVVVVNTWLWSMANDPTIQRIDRFVNSALGRFLYIWLNFSARVLVRAAFGDKKRLTSRVHRQYIAPFGSRKQRRAPYALARALSGSSAFYAALWARRSSLEGIDMTIVWGDKDPAFTAEQRETWCQAFPKARVVRIPDAGHFVAEERPEVVVDVLRNR